MNLIGYLIAWLLFTGSGSTENTKIYIVRHAEKSTEPANDPHLNDAGKQRAQALKEMLANKNIAYIFSTNTNRTVETAYPFSMSVNIPIRYYSNDTLSQFLQMITSLKMNVLVIGHSNTILPMLDKLDLSHHIKTIPDNEYANLFIITVKQGKAADLKETTYGSVSSQ